jgi:hypothetical protein
VGRAWVVAVVAVVMVAWAMVVVVVGWVALCCCWALQQLSHPLLTLTGR